MTRLPIRLKLAAVFAGAMALLLALVGGFLFLRTKSNLDEAIRASLRTREGNLRAYAAAAGRDPGIERGERDAQLIAADGRVLAARPRSAPPMLDRAEVRAALRDSAFIKRGEHARLLAGPAHLDGRTVVAVVGASLANRERALEGLARALFIGGPLALLLASAIGYALAAAALQPVESMRRRADGISRASPDARLPVPGTRDEIGRLGETLNDMLARLAAAAAYERSFVANASHELRTPLATLRAELELALRHAREPGEYQAALRAAIHDADRLAALADDLLIQSRNDAGQPARRDAIDLPALLRSVAAEFSLRPETAARDIGVRCEVDALLGEEPSLRRALLNLVDNALVHGRGDVELAAVREGDGGVRISVADGGPPLPEELRRRAFERFVQGPGAGTRVGSGLGLSIVRAVMDAHGGDAQLVNQPGGGVRVDLRFPAATQRGAVAPLTLSSPPSG